MNPEDRLARLEARVEIRELVARYCSTVDAREITGMGECFTHGGSFRSIHGELNATGRDAVIEQIHTRFAVLGPSNHHFTQGHLITFDDDEPTRATGVVNAHAEVVPMRTGPHMRRIFRRRLPRGGPITRAARDPSEYQAVTSLFGSIRSCFTVIKNAAPAAPSTTR